MIEEKLNRMDIESIVQELHFARISLTQLDQLKAMAEADIEKMEARLNKLSNIKPIENV